jgi:hypothetical protein
MVPPGLVGEGPAALESATIPKEGATLRPGHNRSRGFLDLPLSLILTVGLALLTAAGTVAIAIVGWHENQALEKRVEALENQDKQRQATVEKPAPESDKDDYHNKDDSHEKTVPVRDPSAASTVRGQSATAAGADLARKREELGITRDSNGATPKLRGRVEDAIDESKGVKDKP